MNKKIKKLKEAVDDYIETDDDIDSDIDTQIKALQDKREQRKRDAQKRRDEIELKKKQEAEENKEAVEFYTKNKEELERIKNIEDEDDRSKELFDLLVPSTGSALTEAGEIIRALNKIGYRYYNDGDMFFEEDAGGAENAASFLCQKVDKVEDKFQEMADKAIDYFYDNDEYENDLKDIVKHVIDYIFLHEELFQKKNKDDYLKYRAIEWELPTLDAEVGLPDELVDAYNNNIITEEDIEDWVKYGILQGYGDDEDIEVEVDVKPQWIHIYNVPFKYKNNLHEFEKNYYDWLVDDLEMFKKDNDIVEKYSKERKNENMENKIRNRKVVKERYLKEEPSGLSGSEYNIATSPNGVKVSAEGSFKSTRLYTHELVSLRVSGIGYGEGDYTWQNRPWQRFTFAEALYEAGENAGLPKELLDKAERESHDLDTWVEYIAEHIDEYLNEDGVKEDYSLRPEFDARQSFYDKSYVRDVKTLGWEVLYSYRTPVAVYDYKNEKFYLDEGFPFSTTTLRHIKEFLLQNDYTGPIAQRNLDRDIEKIDISNYL